MQEFYDLCKENGLKVTPQRIAIYEAIAGLASHPSADDIYRIVRTTHPTISFDTVNRTLRTFVEMGVLNTVESHSGARRYDPILTEHHHIHCVRCGKTVDFEFEAFNHLKIPEDVAGEFEILNKRITLHGICGECRKKSN